ncbi:MAG: hypothetical protein U1B83_03070, partial [Candidatus Cloacimonadaceae bacterium]|nr:hypothetical protein [Candidatus Cloacimonadaceae bacterium]
MKACKNCPELWKKLAPAAGLAILCTAVSVTVSLVVTALVCAHIVKAARLKESLIKLFPDYDWEFTGIYQSLNRVCFTVYYQEGFLGNHPDA